MNGTDAHRPLFQLDVPLKNPLHRKLFPIIKSPLEKTLLLSRINRMYRDIEKSEDTKVFLKNIMELLNIRCHLEEKDIQRIPAKGPVIAVMNHPFGGIEGILLASLLHSRRNDIKIMANFLLAGVPELADMFIFVDPFQQQDSKTKNIKALREAIEWVRGGGIMGVFPAGEVAHFDFNNRKVIDPPWSPTIARLIKRTGASVLPIYVNGANGPLFQIAGLIHPRLRTALLPRELLNKQNKEVDIRIGQPIPYKTLSAYESDQQMIDYLRQRTYFLKHRPAPPGTPKRSLFQGRGKVRRLNSVVSSTHSTFLAEEIRNLPAKQTLLQHAEYQVAYARAAQIPYILREIGRLREITFRQAGEGTGKALDLDEFDTFYVHLFIWKVDTQEVIGAYRLGPTDQLLSRFGKKGLYTQTLFTFRSSFFTHINPALEMGRSFVRVEYQKSYNALLLLWKGIGQYVVRFPRYRYLFGPVSINREYQDQSRKLMMTYLKNYNFLPDLAKWIKPKNPFPFKPEDWILNAARFLVRDIEEVSSWVSELEPDEKGVPVLLKQYLKLGGKLLGFNIDAQFSDVLDGLILVDLTLTDNRILERYMGKEGAERFRGFHEQPPEIFGESLISPQRAA